MADATAGARTPSPPPSIRTPPAPRFGFGDNWEPYPSRKSARLSSQQSAARTPSPRAEQRHNSGSPRSKKKLNEQRAAAMVSPAASPQKKRQLAAEPSRRVSGALTAESTADAASALGFANPSAEKSLKSTLTRTTGMLPTPSKTPQKAPNEKTVASIQTFARNLFPQESSTATPRKKRVKQYTGMTLESFTAEDVEDPITIYTDSQDRIPVRDDSDSNPFLSKVAEPAEPAEPAKRRSKRRHVNVPGENSQSVEEASRRDDGMVYVFRGKRFFRKFSNDDEASLSRNNVKPRVLFKERRDEIVEEEEAATDIEEGYGHEEDDEAEVPQTPTLSRKERVKTPEAPKFAPVSPPDTKRVTRSTNKLLDDGTPTKGSGRRSPFDTWQRTKEHQSRTGTKRQGSDLAEAPAKRTRV